MCVCVCVRARVCVCVGGGGGGGKKKGLVKGETHHFLYNVPIRAKLYGLDILFMAIKNVLLHFLI